VRAFVGLIQQGVEIKARHNKEPASTKSERKPDYLFDFSVPVGKLNNFKYFESFAWCVSRILMVDPQGLLLLPPAR
jgi:hypothetical protein